MFKVMNKLFFRLIILSMAFVILLTIACSKTEKNQNKNPNNTNITPPASIDIPVIKEISLGDYLDKIYICWKADTVSNFHEIYRSSNSETGYNLVGESSINAYTDFNVEQGKNYYYYIRSGWKAPTDPSIMVFSENSDTKAGSTHFNLKPETIAATTDDPDKITISWDKVLSAEKYNIYGSNLKENINEYKLIALVDGTENSHNYTPEHTGKRYYFYVQAVNSDNILSSASDIAEGYCCLTKPSDLTASTNYYKVIKLSWTKVPYTRYYEIFRDNEKIGTSAFTRYKDESEDLITDNSYSYSVRAISYFGIQSDLSDNAFGKIRDPLKVVKCKFSWKRSNARGVNSLGGGYYVYYSNIKGFKPGDNSTFKVDVPYDSKQWTPVETSVTLKDPGKWYYRVSAYFTKDSDIIESKLSEEREFIIE